MLRVRQKHHGCLLDPTGRWRRYKLRKPACKSFQASNVANDTLFSANIRRNWENVRLYSIRNGFIFSDISIGSHLLWVRHYLLHDPVLYFDKQKEMKFLYYNHILVYSCERGVSPIFILLAKWLNMNHDMTKPIKWHVRPAKTQISLGIRPVWSESSLSAWRKLGSLATHWAHSKDSDQAGRMPRLIWVFDGRTVILLVMLCRGSHGL